jgi:hypothetical protein
VSSAGPCEAGGGECLQAGVFWRSASRGRWCAAQSRVTAPQEARGGSAYKRGLRAECLQLRAECLARAGVRGGAEGGACDASRRSAYKRGLRAESPHLQAECLPRAKCRVRRLERRGGGVPTLPGWLAWGRSAHNSRAGGVPQRAGAGNDPRVLGRTPVSWRPTTGGRVPGTRGGVTGLECRGAECLQSGTRITAGVERLRWAVSRRWELAQTRPEALRRHKQQAYKSHKQGLPCHPGLWPGPNGPLGSVWLVKQGVCEAVLFVVAPSAVPLAPQDFECCGLTSGSPLEG